MKSYIKRKTLSKRQSAKGEISELEIKVKNMRIE